MLRFRDVGHLMFSILKVLSKLFNRGIKSALYSADKRFEKVFLPKEIFLIVPLDIVFQTK